MSGKKLQGQVAIITGASRGIGAAAARHLARAGADVVLVARDELDVESAAAGLRARGWSAVGVAADVSDPEHLDPVIEFVLDEYRRIDILVNSAALVWPLDEVAECDLDEWAYTVHVNLVAPFYLTRTVLPVMQAQGHGRILNLSSEAARQPLPGASAYCASKAGLEMFTRVLALELAGTPVTANLLDPGMVDTDLQADLRSVDTSETRLDFGAFHAAHQEGRLLSADRVAQLIYWLVGPWSRSRSGELFSAADAVWLAQVDRDLDGGSGA